jgi:uncharacterized Tic20 family protein
METVEIKSQDKTLAILVHLAGLFTSWVGPLIIYLIKKDSDPFTAANAREALNFQLTIMVALIISYILVFIIVGVFMVGIVMLINLIFSIRAAVKASNGSNYRYPFTIRLIN